MLEDASGRHKDVIASRRRWGGRDVAAAAFLQPLAHGHSGPPKTLDVYGSLCKRPARPPPDRPIVQPVTVHASRCDPTLPGTIGHSASQRGKTRLRAGMCAYAQASGTRVHSSCDAILARLREHGPATVTGLSPYVGASPSVTSWHLCHLAAHGLVEDAPLDGRGRQRWWQAVGKGSASTAGTIRRRTASYSICWRTRKMTWCCAGAARCCLPFPSSERRLLLAGISESEPHPTSCRRSTTP